MYTPATKLLTNRFIDNTKCYCFFCISFRYGKRGGKSNYGKQRTVGHKVSAITYSPPQCNKINSYYFTRNALNVVKDDLIVKVDELTGELEMLREEILSLNLSRTKLRERVGDLEEEVRKLRETNEAKQEIADEEADVPMAQRKRFTRVEMARVLMERNQYKVNVICCHLIEGKVP